MKLAIAGIVLSTTAMSLGQTRPSEDPVQRFLREENEERARVSQEYATNEEQEFQQWSKFLDADGSPTLRGFAIDNVVHSPERAIPLLIRRLNIEKLPMLRLELIDALSRCGDCQTSRDALWTCFNDSDEDDNIRDAAAMNLGKWQDTRPLPILYEYLADDHTDKQLTALRWLQYFRNQESGARVATYLVDAVSRGRDDCVAAAIVSLGKLQYAPCQKDLMRLMEKNRADHKYWDVLIPVIDSMGTNDGSHLRDVIAQEDAAIAQAQEQAKDADKAYAMAFSQWQSNVRDETAKRAQSEQKAAEQAAIAWIKSDPVNYTEAFDKLFIKKFAESRGYEHTRAMIGSYTPRPGEVIAKNAQYVQSTFYKRDEPDSTLNLTFTFMPAEDGLSMEVVQITGDLQAFGLPKTIIPSDLAEMASVVQKGIGRQSPQYRDPNTNLLSIDQMYPKPQPANITVPLPTSHVF